MNCPSCQHENPDRAKFCLECGAPFAARCVECGCELPPAAKFCLECGARQEFGASRGESAPVRREPGSGERERERERLALNSADGTRKVVSILFADLAGSTALHERLDAESARLFMESYYRAMRGAVEGHGGRVAKLLGDGVMAVFGLPQVAEDDALRAVRAAVAMQRAFRELAEWHSALVGKLGLRVAVNTGEVVAKDETELIGDPVNVAARLQDQARDGDVVIGEATRSLVAALVSLEPLGNLTLKGRAEAVRAYRVVSLEKPASATTSAFVGRDAELARLAAVHQAVVTTPATRLAVLLGSPGLGKSRLIAEFVQRQHEAATVVTAHCDAAGGATFAPIAKALREYLGIDDGADDATLRSAVDDALSGDLSDRSRIGDGIAALLAGSPASPEETFFVVRRLFTALAAKRPVVLVVDDLHWGAPLLLDLVEHLVQWGSNVPLFVLVGARPELRDARSSLATRGALVSDVVVLGGLDAGAAMRLAANMIGAADLPSAVAAKVLATSEGNPLFVGELVRMLVHEGALMRDGDRWTIGAGLAALEMPPTIHALLAARIERLKPEERLVLERAAVVGRHFSRSALAELLPPDFAGLDARLEALRRSELIEADTGWFLGEPVLRFHHVLIRDAAYRRLLKNTRAELHARLAGWIESRSEAAADAEETIGWHLEQAHLHLRELGPVDADGRELGERASRHLAAAGRKALARDDLPLAANLLGRALDQLDKDDAKRAELALDWCEALLAAGNVAAATTAIEELGHFVGDSPRLRAWHTCFAGQFTALTAPRELHATADAVAAAAAALAHLGDASGEAKAHSVHAQALARLGKVGACEAALDKALAAARRVGDRRRANAVLAGAPQAALWGPSPVTRASGRCLDVVRVLRITQGAPAVEAMALSCQGVLEALRGRTDAARRMVAASRRMVEELGITHRLLEADVCAGRIDLLEGDAVAAERRLRIAYEGLRDLGLGSDAAQAAALLARALLALGRGDDAEALSHESESLAGDDLQAAIAWRGVRAEALALRGEHAMAVELARAAVAIAAETDALLDHADACLALAAALRAAGRGDEAATEERKARELWKAKGATLLAGRSADATSTPLPDQPPDQVQADSRGVTGHRVNLNAATRSFERLSAGVMAKDIDAVMAEFADGGDIVHHPTGMRYGKDTLRESWPQLFDVANLTYRHDPLATLGERLALGRRLIRSDGFHTEGALSFGPLEVENILLVEVDGNGCRRRTEIFAPEHLTEALVRLHEFHAESLTEAAARTRAATVARSILAMTNGNHVDGFKAAFSPRIEVLDRRLAGFGHLHGRAAALTAVAAFLELVEDSAWRTDDVLGCTADLLLVLSTNRGRDRSGGGNFERRIHSLVRFDDDGLVAYWEIFEAEQGAEALATFDRWNSAIDSLPPTSARVRRNAATRGGDRVQSAFASRNQDRLDDRFAEDLVVVDHPNGITYGRDGQLDSLHRFLRSHDPKLQFRHLASLGPQLSLSARWSSASGTSGGRFDVGEYERLEFVVSRADANERMAHLETFGADRLGDAIARLYALRAEELPEGPARSRTATIARVVSHALTPTIEPDPSSLVAPEFEAVDHRPVVGHGGIDFAALQQGDNAWRESTVGLHFHVDDVLALEEDGLLRKTTASGNLLGGGGVVERTTYALSMFGADGRCTRHEVFDVSQEKEAWARFDELTGSATAGAAAAPSCLENAASSAWRRWLGIWQRRDWESFDQAARPDVRLLDRRRMAQLELGGAELLAYARQLGDMESTRFGPTVLLGTRGNSLSLMRDVLEVEDRDVGPSTIEYLSVVEIDANGLCRSIVRFDIDDAAAAFAELQTRYEAGEGAGKEDPSGRFEIAIAARDWAGIMAMANPAMIERDLRPLSVLETSHGPVAWIQSFRNLAEIAPDMRWFTNHLRVSARSWFSVGGWRGTMDGGEFEIPFVVSGTLDDDGRYLEIELRDLAQVEEAFARYEEMTRAGTGAASAKGGAGSPIPSNLAMRTFESFRSHFLTGNWDAIRARVRDDFVYEDRGRRALVVGNLETWIESVRYIFGLPGVVFEQDVLGTCGDRVVISHLRWRGSASGPAFETEKLHLAEVDEQGRVSAVILFDPEDRRLAFREGMSRFVEGEARGSVHAASMRAFGDALNVGRFETLIDILHPDYVLDDHRPLSFGVLSASQWIEALETMAELAPDFSIENVCVIAWSDRGILQRLRTYGTLKDGGPFENCYLAIQVDSQGLRIRSEIYPEEQLETALARFRELCGDTVSPASD